MISRKGQGATEYLVLFAVVLIIAMVVIALLGFFPSVGSGAKQSASDAYWQSTRPIQVGPNDFVASNGHFDIRVSNSGSDAIKINWVAVATSQVGANGVSAAYATPLTLGTGESTNITIQSFIPAGTARCTNGSSYEYYIGFGYTQGSYSYLLNGTKPIIGKCG